MLLVPWLSVSDSESVLVSSNVLMPEQGFTSAHFRSDLEFNVMISLFWPGNTSLVNEPCLIKTVVAVPEDYMSVVGV